MCGIVGSIGPKANKLNENTLNSLIHRGPDGKGIFRKKNCFLGHTRLSIQDTSDSASQPMFSSDGNSVIIFNGEIYNHQVLRKKYLKEVNFKSHGDTETLLYGIKTYGDNFIEKLNGIFAFFYLNLINGEFILCRDHFGVKPLYYYHNDHDLFFASEIKALLTDKTLDLSIDTEAIKNYLNFLWSPGEKTPFNEIKKMLPGTLLKGNINNIKNAVFQRYYVVPFEGNYFSDISEEGLILKLDKHLTEAVERQLLSDVPIGFFLSGGLDSSLITAIVRKLRPHEQINCFTIKTDKIDGFSEDLGYAIKVAQHLNLNLEIVEARSNDLISLFKNSLFYLDEPQADPAPINVDLICKAAKQKGIKVLIGGVAGDDIFSGYRRHQTLKFEPFIEKIPLLLKSTLKKTTFLLNKKNNTLRRLNKLLSNINLEKEDRMLSYFNWIDDETLSNLFVEPNNFDCSGYLKSLNSLIPNEKSDLNRMLFWEMNTFLPDHNLNYTDKMGMANGIEIRVPFLDKELVEFSTKIPPKFKLKGSQTKYLLKKVAERYLPNEIIYRPKTGFGAPVRKWITEEMDLILEEYLSEDNVRKRGIFNYDKLQTLLYQNKKGKIDASYTILSLLLIELWFRNFKD